MQSVSESLSAESFVILRSGLAVRVEAVRLLIDLESRGVQLERDGCDILLRAPANVTDEDRAGLRRFKVHVLALIDHAERIGCVQ